MSRKAQINQREEIVNKLKKAGKKGVLNTELVKIGIGYRTRVSELYKLGYRIDCSYVNKSIVRYTLIAEPKPDHEADMRNALDIISEDIDKLRGFVKKEELIALLEHYNFHIVRKNGSYKL